MSRAVRPAGEAARTRDELLRNNPDAQRQLDLFRLEPDKGRWVYVGRYATELPAP